MPSLIGLSRNMGTAMLNLIFARGGPADPMLRRNFNNYIRLVDLSVELYEKARSYAENSLPRDNTSSPADDLEYNNQRLGSILRAIDYLELCVYTVHRAIGALDRLNDPDLPIERPARRAIKSLCGQLCDVRNAVSHIDGDIARGRISTGQSHALMISEDGRTASIGRHTLVLDDFGLAVRRLHELAKTLSEYCRKGV
jgi:hypothetical protein